MDTNTSLNHFNTSSNLYESVSFRTPFYILSNGLGLVLAIFIALLNGFVLYAISRKQRVWDTPLCLIWNMALVDTVNGILLFYNIFYNLAYFQNFCECLLRYGCMHGVKVSSILLLLGISVERYIRIVWPLHYWNFLKESNIKIFIKAIWMLGLLFAVGPFITWIQDWPKVGFCQYFSVLKPSYIWFTCATMMVAFLIQCFIYCHILIIARKACLEDQRNTTRVVSSLVLWWRPTKTILVIIGSNLITLGPLGVFLMVSASGVLDSWSIIDKGVWLACITTPGYVNNMINPLLYAFKTLDIGLLFKQKFCLLCWKRRRQVLVATIEATESSAYATQTDAVALASFAASEQRSTSCTHEIISYSK